jgi:exonuclease III
MGEVYRVYHDPSPKSVGRGVAKAISNSLGAKLTNIKYGTDINKIAAGRLITGDLTFQTQNGEIKTIEITSFYVPCDKKDKQPFLDILGPYLRARSNRDGVARIAGGDGNGIWEPNERIRKDGTPSDDNSEEASAFRTCMESCPDLFNQKPPGSFCPETQPTHEYAQGKAWEGKSRIDYLFMNAHLEECVRHTSPLEQICVPTVTTEEKKVISVHYCIEATIPLQELGDIVRPIQRIHLLPHRIKVDLANPTERLGAVELIRPALEVYCTIPANARSIHRKRSPYGIISSSQMTSVLAHLERCIRPIS